MENIEVEETQDPEAQKIIDAINNGEETVNEVSEDEKLPSEIDKEEIEETVEEEGKLAGKFADIDALKKGLSNIGSELPQYIIDGMSDEALEQHYTELDKAFNSKTKEEREDGKKHLVKEEKKEDAKEEKSPSKAVSPELWTELKSQFDTKGGIDEGMYDKLEEAGIPASIVDDYIDGIKLKQESFTKSVHDIAGGQENFENVKTWAEDNLDSEYIESIGKMSQNQMLNSMKGIMAQYEAANGKTVRIEGNSKNTTSNGYRTKQEYLDDVAAIRNEKMATRVDAKLARSKFK